MAEELFRIEREARPKMFLARHITSTDASYARFVAADSLRKHVSLLSFFPATSSCPPWQQYSLVIPNAVSNVLRLSPRLEFLNDIAPPLSSELVFALGATKDISKPSTIMQSAHAIPHLWTFSPLPSLVSPSPHAPYFAFTFHSPLTSVIYPTYPTADGTTAT